MTRDTPQYPVEKPRIETQIGIDFSDLIYAFWQGKWAIIITTACAIFAGGYYAFVIVTPLYQSSSVVILEPKTDKIVTFQTVSSGLTGDTPEVNSEVEILRARSLMHDVVDHLGLFNDPEFNRTLTPPTAKVVLKSQIKRKLGWFSPPEILSEQNFNRRTRDSVVSALLRKVRIENLRQSTVFRISVQTKSAAKSAQIADAIAEIYIKRQVARKVGAAAQATVWLETRVDELQIELEHAEIAVSGFSASTALVSPEKLQALKRQIKAMRERIIAAEQKAVLSSLNAKTLENADSVETKIAAADDGQLSRFAQEDRTKVAFEQRFETIKTRATSDLVRTRQQLETLKVSEATLSLRIAKQGQDLISLQQLNREAQATRVLYEHFLTRLKETAAQQGLQNAYSRILSPAVIPYNPSEPRKSLILSMSAIFGLGASIFFVLFGELRRTTFRSLSGLERYLGIIGIARLPVLPVNRKADFLDYLSAHPTDWFPNAIRGLRTSLMLSPTAKTQTIAVTSAQPDEGCSATAVALAYDFTRLGKRVLLVDTNQTKDGLNDYFGDEPTRGVFSILRGEHEMNQSFHHPENLGADILFATDNSLSAGDLFLSQAFQTFLDDMRDRYDIVLLNVPAIMTSPSAHAVLKSAETVLLNVKWDSTNKHQVNNAMRILDNIGITVTGLILSETGTDNFQPQTNFGKWIGTAFHPSRDPIAS